VVGKRAGGGQALCQGGHAGRRFQRVLRRDQPPDPIQAEQPERRQADLAMAAVGRIEGTAEEPDPGARRRQAAAQRGGQALGRGGCAPGGQGLTAPLPRTWYL
jgi:hypothetical protein